MGYIIVCILSALAKSLTLKEAKVNILGMRANNNPFQIGLNLAAIFLNL
jgi:hypothetical protein